MQGPRTKQGEWAVIYGIAAVRMIRKGQVLGITRQNRHDQASVFASLLRLPETVTAELSHNLRRRRRCNTFRLPGEARVQLSHAGASRVRESTERGVGDIR